MDQPKHLQQNINRHLKLLRPQHLPQRPGRLHAAPQKSCMAGTLSSEGGFEEGLFFSFFFKL